MNTQIGPTGHLTLETIQELAHNRSVWIDATEHHAFCTQCQMQVKQVADIIPPKEKQSTHWQSSPSYATIFKG